MRLPDNDPSLADEFDRVCAVYFREWEDERELNRLKRAIAWAFGGKDEGGQGGRAECPHEHFERLPSGDLKCRDCGEVGN